MKKNLLVIAALVVVAAMCIAAAPAASAQAPAQSAASSVIAAATPITATVSVVGIAPGFGDINPKTSRPTGIAVGIAAGAVNTYTLFSPGTANVPPGVPTYVEAGALGLAEGAKLAKFEWSLKGPDGSAAKIVAVTKPVLGLSVAMATYTPDKEGAYVVTVIVTDDKGNKSVAGTLNMVAAKYVGNEACKACHKDAYEGWSKTAHGSAFQRFIDENAEGEYFTAGYGCARCHTVGYYPVTASTGGWWEMMGGKDGAKNWPKDKIALGAFGATSTFTSAFDAKVQLVSNIGCETCHGPAGAHVAKPSKDTAPMPTTGSMSCSQCHNASGHHTRGGAVANSAHAKASELGEGSNPACARCHSSAGFIDTLAGAKTIRAVNDDIGCATCHDPHSDENPFQLRMVNTVKFTVQNTSDATKLDTVEIKDAGLSALCMSCHNARRGAKIVTDDKATRYTPHASTATEMIAGIGGYDWGMKVSNSAHVNIGKGIINDEHSNQPGNMGFTQINDGVAPGACVLCHMYRTPGGVWDTADSMKVPGHQQIGGHTFAMVTLAADGKTEIQHTDPCQQCHPGIKDFNFTAKADYDGNGKVEGVETEAAGVAKALSAAITGWKDAAGKQITVDAKTGAFVFPKDIKLTTDVKGAIYNYTVGTQMGGAAVIHNANRAIGLMQVSIEKVSGKPLAKATLLYSK